MNSDKGFKWQLISIAIYFFYFRKKEMFSVRREAEGTILYLLGTKRRQPAAFYDNFFKKKNPKFSFYCDRTWNFVTGLQARSV